MELELRTTGVFTKNYEALNNPSIRFVVNQGGSRSSKTYSLCQLLIVYSLQHQNKVVSIVRKSLPSLKATIMRDFFEVMKELNIYDEKKHNKTENIYSFPNGSVVEFFSLDDSQKVRGRKRDVLLMNEANELEYEEFLQLNMRTTDKVFCDFNPSDTEHFLYDLIEKEDAIKIHSTYKDNPFLGKDIIKQIEELIMTDKDYYNIYALGIPSKSTHTIYNHQQTYLNKDKPESIVDTILGLDFGFQHPTALIRCDFTTNNEVFMSELLYESYLTTADLIPRIKQLLDREGLSYSTTIVCDYARPEIITELNRNGFNCVNANKSVKEGIDAVKSKILFIHTDSVNMLKEFKNYKWKSTKDDKLLDEPVKMWDDAMDAMRYAILYYKNNNVSTGSWSFESFSF